MNINPLLKRNFYTIRGFLIVFGTLIFWYAFYFADQKIAVECIPSYLLDYRMYLALFFSVVGSFSVSFTTGAFNKENIKRITTLEKEDEK